MSYEYMKVPISVKADATNTIDWDAPDWFIGGPKWKCYQMRGAQVTEEQALDIIIKTEDILLDFLEFVYKEKTLSIELIDEERITHVGIYEIEQYLRNKYNKTFEGGKGLKHLKNSLYDYREGSWIHENGMIGRNATAGCEWLSVSEIVEDLVILYNNFEYLDIFIAVHGYCNMFDCIRNSENYKESDRCRNSIEYGVQLKAGMITVYPQKIATEIFRNTYNKQAELPIWNRHRMEESVKDRKWLSQFFYSKELIRKALKEFGYEGKVVEAYIEAREKADQLYKE